MTKKETKNKTIEIRVSAKELHKLKLRAQLYSEGNISKLIRHWINHAPLQFLPRTKTPKEESSENEIMETNF